VPIGGLIGGHLVVQGYERGRESSRVLADPPIGNLLDGRWIEVVPLRASIPRSDHQIGVSQHGEVFHHSEAGHLGKHLAQLVECLPVAVEQAIQECPSGRVSECPKDFTALVHTIYNM
jgi:hypothetical protein